MSEKTQIGGPITFGLFALAVNIVLINWLITVILEAFTAVRTDETKQSNDYEIVEFMIKRMKLFLGLGRHSNTGDTKDDKNSYRQSMTFLVFASSVI